MQKHWNIEKELRTKNINQLAEEMYTYYFNISEKELSDFILSTQTMELVYANKIIEKFLNSTAEDVDIHYEWKMKRLYHKLFIRLWGLKEGKLKLKERKTYGKTLGN